MPSKNGFGNTRKKSPAMKYGAGKNPIMMKGAKPDYIDIDKDGNTTESMKDAASSAKMYGKKSMARMYDKKSPAKKYAPGQAAAIYAQKADDAKKKKRK